jgi:hypothetical protein
MVDPIITPLVLTALLGAGASLISGFLGSNAANQAANTEAQAIKYGVDLQGKLADQARRDALPWMEAGKGALEQYLGEIGLSSTGIGGTQFQSRYEETPDYKYAVEEAEKGVVGNLNALGMKNSGAALKALTKVRHGIASTFRGDYLNRLASMAGVGQTQVNATNALAATTGANQARGMADIGATRASGYVGGANAWTNALGNFSNNMGSALGRYNQNWQMMGAV